MIRTSAAALAALEIESETGVLEGDELINLGSALRRDTEIEKCEIEELLERQAGVHHNRGLDILGKSVHQCSDHQRLSGSNLSGQNQDPLAVLDPVGQIGQGISMGLRKKKKTGIGCDLER